VKFLIDECLSPELVKLAQDKGHAESSHVVWRKLAGKKDWELKPIILDGDWTFVTRNSTDFRGPASRPGSRGVYSDVVIHAGLVCLNGPEGINIDTQRELFEQALEVLAAGDDLINQVVEITLEENDELHVLRYNLPPESA
jgi:hypothetical protein